MGLQLGDKLGWRLFRGATRSTEIGQGSLGTYESGIVAGFLSGGETSARTLPAIEALTQKVTHGSSPLGIDLRRERTSPEELVEIYIRRVLVPDDFSSQT